MSNDDQILVLEDDLVMLESLVEALEDGGYQVVQASTAREALEAARAHTFSLVIHDVRMADMDGLETLAALREIQPQVKPIIMTGYAEGDAPSRAIQQGAFDYLYKPFKLDDLLKTVSQALRSEQLDQENLHTVEEASEEFRQNRARLEREQRERLEQSRMEAFRAFFVGIRSRKLFRKGARQAWQHLEALESRFRKLKSEEITELDLAYRLVSQRLGHEKDPDFSNLNALDVPFADFYKLFTKVLEGTVSLPQLMLAPFLRVFPSSTSDLTTMRDRIWG